MDHSLHRHLRRIISRIMSTHTICYDKHVGQVAHRLFRGIDIILIDISFPSDIGYGKRLEHVKLPPVRVHPGSVSPAHDGVLTVRRRHRYPGPFPF